MKVTKIHPNSPQKGLIPSLYVVFSLVSIVLLTSCSPRYPVQGVARSSKPYYLHGTWHYPQQHYEYNKVGLASWYGPGFHLGKKAQGEAYNQHEMSAAHRTLPLPTIVRVKNLENGLTIVVLIDDRGPFKYKDRIIDLSVSAAKALKIHNQGVCKVQVTALPDESHAFSMYLKKHGSKDRRGRKQSWCDLYRQEIGNKMGYAQLTPLPFSEHHAYREAKRQTKEIENSNGIISHTNTRVKNINALLLSKYAIKKKGS